VLRHSPFDYARSIEAAVLLAGASLAIRFLPFRRLTRLMGRVEPGSSEPRTDPAIIRVAIKRAAFRLPWKIVCFQEGLAAHWMLRRRGVRSRLHYGIRPAGDRLSAHVWVEAHGQVVIGEEEQGQAHHRVAVFPAGTSEHAEH
jgi:hypothetical protein